MIDSGVVRRRFVLLMIVVWGGALAPVSHSGDPSDIAQKWCPVMPEERIDPGVSVVHEGRRVYFCCARCKAKFLADPESYADGLPSGAGATSAHGAHGHDHTTDHAAPAVGWRRWLAYLGRFHVMAVHFPVALLLLAALCDLAALCERWRSLASFVAALAGTGAITSLAALGLGFAHAIDTTYQGRRAAYLDWHRTGGIATTVAAFVAWTLVARRSREGAGSQHSVARRRASDCRAGRDHGTPRRLAGVRAGLPRTMTRSSRRSAVSMTTHEYPNHQTGEQT